MLECVVSFIRGNSDIINTVSSVFMAVGACAIPFVIFHMQKKLDERKNQVGESNAMLLKLIDDRINANFQPIMTDQIDELFKSEEARADELKTKAYEFICLKIIATTAEVGEYLGIEKNETVEILLRLFRIEGRIKPAAWCDPSEDNAPWQKA